MSASLGQLQVEMFPASFGDAVLIRCVSSNSSFNILVDAGVSATYEEHLAARLRELHSQGEKLNLLVVTHIDTDHIGGVLSLLKANGHASSPNVIEICDIWHNGYRHLNLQGRVATESEKQKVISQVSNPGSRATAGHQISVREADTLARLITEHGYAWNKAFGGEAALAPSKISLSGCIDLTLLSPTQPRLDRLAYAWQRDLLAMGVSHEAVECSDFEAAFEMELPHLDVETEIHEKDISASTINDPPCPSTFVEDASITNGSSIAFLLECFGLRTLFLGDSWPSVITEQWESLHPGAVHEQVDLVKVSHHASRRNTSPTLLAHVTANNYVVSTDGSRHAHPDIETLLWIADVSEAGSSQIYNYPSQTAEHMAQQTMRERFGHNVKIGTGDEPVVITFSGEVDGER